MSIISLSHKKILKLIENNKKIIGSLCKNNIKIKNLEKYLITNKIVTNKDKIAYCKFLCNKKKEFKPKIDEDVIFLKNIPTSFFYILPIMPPTILYLYILTR